MATMGFEPVHLELWVTSGATSPSFQLVISTPEYLFNKSPFETVADYKHSFDYIHDDAEFIRDFIFSKYICGFEDRQALTEWPMMRGSGRPPSTNLENGYRRHLKTMAMLGDVKLCAIIALLDSYGSLMEAIAHDSLSTLVTPPCNCQYWIHDVM
ncbi:hypothetical protein VNO77_34180 [Canavalia gladiata]|uniref:Uncharacterized protein n=1 Tax=Canavalia gladiata TaxID=3824 RepID=A0AAN9KF47_CANGL